MASLTEEYLKRKTSRPTKRTNSCFTNKNRRLPRLVSAGFEGIIKRLDVTERVEELEKKVSRIMEAINLRA